MLKKKNKYNEEDYIYGSARIAAIDNKKITDESFRSCAEARSYEEAVMIIEKCGINIRNGIEEALNEHLKDAYASLNTLAPDEKLFDFFRLQYDCHNIKSAIKAAALHKNCIEMLYSIGTVDRETVINKIREKDYSLFPKHMSLACDSCFDEYYKSSNPQAIDIILDKACFDDLNDAANESGIEYIKELVNHKADSVNILIAVRMIRMDAPESLLRSTLVNGGKIKIEDIIDAATFGSASEKEDNIYYLASKNGYDLGLEHTNTLTQVEKACESLYFDFVLSSANDCVYGIELPCSFIVKREREIKNIRIVLSGKKAGISPALILERLR